MASTEEKSDGKSVVKKESKKDRHMKLVHDLGKFLEKTNEITVQEVLLLTRVSRETLESVDIDLDKFCKDIDRDSFLLDKWENDLIQLLNNLKGKISHRESIINQLEKDLDNTEVKRASIVGTELKTLVDKLISIGYQLPDDIERLVENESYELNKDIINNRLEHAKTIANMRILHVQREYLLIENWENTRKKWRLLRHEQAINQFHSQINSDDYFNPDDRLSYMKRFRQDQTFRKQVIMKYIALLEQQNFATITSEKILEVQAQLNQCNDQELSSIQECYNKLNNLKNNTNYQAKERVEELRKELHIYGALQIDPKLTDLANQVNTLITKPQYEELFRLSGGLKPDLQTIVSELTCDEIVYDRVMHSIRDKIDLVNASFDIKPILQDRGRLIQLEKIRGLVTKLRSVPRQEIAQILKTVLPEFEEVLGMDLAIPDLFKSTLQGISNEIKDELANFEIRLSQHQTALATTQGINGGTSLAATGTLNATPSTVTLKKPVTFSNTQNSIESGKTKNTFTSSKTSKKAMTEKEKDPMLTVYIDPLLLKAWHRKLGILFYSSELELEDQNICKSVGINYQNQLQCNSKVDQVIINETTKVLFLIDYQYKKLINNIVNYLEVQANDIYIQTMNAIDYYLKLAKLLEFHRIEQKKLDDKSADELWDCQEENRLLLEDKEDQYHQLCHELKQSTKDADIAIIFQKILHLLDEIQQVYRDYHQEACFKADKYPVYIINAYRNMYVELGKAMMILPKSNHPLLADYERLFDAIIRFNKKFFDESPNAAEVNRLSFEDLINGLPLTQDEYQCPFIKPPQIVDPTSSQDSLSIVDIYQGGYLYMYHIIDIYKKFNSENAFKPKESTNETGTDNSTSDEIPQEENTSGSSNAAAAAARALFQPHPDCPYMKSDSVVIPMSQEAFDQLDASERDEYESNLVKGFLPVVDPETSLSPEELINYNDLVENISKIKTRLSFESSPDYIRNHLPTDKESQPWILHIEVTENEIASMYSIIRDNIINSIERESFKKLISIERQMETRKKDYTDQLEDRIRNHWPRRGRVETEIKQPREKELLAHKEKTFRYITNIQQKMIELQQQFEDYLSESYVQIEKYRNDLLTEKNLVNGEYKNLAALQGIDVKARNLTLDFQNDANKRIQQLTKYSKKDTDGIISFTRDFIKLCPPQQLNVEGGYSPSELKEIEDILENQVVEIIEISHEWEDIINKLESDQNATQQDYDSFLEKYAICTQEVAMAEGLGQKYGAPRRRAQEKIRTEVSKDERNAGKVDEYLAQIEFMSSEVKIFSNTVEALSSSDNHSDVSSVTSSINGKSNSMIPKPSDVSNMINLGKEGLEKLYFLWHHLIEIRSALQRRVAFLNVKGDTTSIPQGFITEIFPWIDENRILEFLSHPQGDPSPFSSSKYFNQTNDSGLDLSTPSAATIEAVYLDVDTNCRKETRALYESEGLTKILGPSGVPDSLNNWLAESKDKLLGRHGYREKAWKRLWSQLERLDALFARYRNNNKDDEDMEEAPSKEVKINQSLVSSSIPLNVKITIQGSCIQFFFQSQILLSRSEWKEKAEQFKKLLKIWEKGREKHERLLRPRLGSPDKLEELNSLDSLESKRSQDMVDNVQKFRTSLIRKQIERLRYFCEDLGNMSKGLLFCLDNIFRQELLQIPPDTAIPKKHMTLKKLRKAQRIKEEVAKGGVDRSQKRIWPGLLFNSESISSIKSFEDLVVDLGADPKDLNGGVEIQPTQANPTDSKKNPPKKPDKNQPVVAAPTVSPSLMPSPWVDKIKETTAIEGLVSSAHRIIIEERNEALESYLKFLLGFLNDVREEYSTILSQEDSWNQRWKRQVEILRSGSL